MTKSEAYKNFKEYETISDSAREDVSRIALKLLDDTFIVKAKDEDRDDYLKARNLFTLLNAFFSFMDFSLFSDDEKGIMYIKTTKDTNRVHLKKLDTISLLLLRYIYDEESQKASLRSDITTTLGKLVQEIRKTDIYRNFDGKSGEFKDALRNLKRHKIIDFDGDLTSGETIITIYRTVLLVVDTKSIEELTRQISLYRRSNNEKI